MKRHFPLVNDVVAVSFLAIIPRDLAKEKRSRIEQFRIFINFMIKSPFEATRTFPEFNRIFLVDVEEVMQFAKNGRGVSLKRM